MRRVMWLALTVAAGVLLATPALVLAQSPCDDLDTLNPTIICTGGLCRGTDGDDVILGTPGDDKIYGFRGNDTICGLGGRDLISGGDGDDIIDGGADNDKLYGGRGDDTIFGGDGNDILSGDSGEDYLFGEDGKDRLYGGSGADFLDGGQDGIEDYLNGGSAAEDAEDPSPNFDTCVDSEERLIECENVI